MPHGLLLNKTGRLGCWKGTVSVRLTSQRCFCAASHSVVGDFILSTLMKETSRKKVHSFAKGWLKMHKFPHLQDTEFLKKLTFSANVLYLPYSYLSLFSHNMINSQDLSGFGGQLVWPCQPQVSTVRIQFTGDENATLLEFTTTSVCKIEFLRPHLGAGFSISQVLLLLA